mmetsp:Transcript_9251/g.20670  ORF Transcript_9251/g.20670 Transcript_9251/m.20670 type:complete len:208 (+) Transcript_9251:1485-2108(+)
MSSSGSGSCSSADAAGPEPDVFPNTQDCSGTSHADEDPESVPLSSSLSDPGAVALNGASGCASTLEMRTGKLSRWRWICSNSTSTSCASSDTSALTSAISIICILLSSATVSSDAATKASAAEESVAARVMLFSWKLRVAEDATSSLRDTEATSVWFLLAAFSLTAAIWKKEEGPSSVPAAPGEASWKLAASLPASCCCCSGEGSSW